LDIRVSSHTRNSEMKLPRDNVPSIATSNGGYYAESANICMYTTE